MKIRWTRPPYPVGETVERSKADAEALINKGVAVPVTKAKRETATKKPKEKRKGSKPGAGKS